MDFSLSDEQRAIADLAAQILRDRCTLGRLKAIEASEDGYDRELWAGFAKAGLLGAALPESAGGSGAGFIDICLLLQEQGRRVAPIPLLAAIVSAAMPLARFGSAEQQQRYLPGVVGGTTLLTAALSELGADSRAPATTARPERKRWRVTGLKVGVPIAAGKAQQEFLHHTGSPPVWGMNWDEDQGAGEYPNAYFFYLPRLCNHCTRPVCVEACPSGALYKRAEDGLVLRDEDRCRGTQDCIRACPYKKIYFNPARRVAQHCIGCFPRIEQGVAPACVRQCSGRAAFVGFIDDEAGAVHQLVRRWRVALPLHPEWNTEAERVLRSAALTVPAAARRFGRHDAAAPADLLPRVRVRTGGGQRLAHSGDRNRPLPAWAVVGVREHAHCLPVEDDARPVHPRPSRDCMEIVESGGA